MATDEERRVIAQKLREGAAKGPRLAREWDEVLCEVIGYRDDEITYVSLVEKLADLIDPGEVIFGATLSTDCIGEALPESLDAFDRDDLLGLADEMEGKAADWDASQDGIPLVRAGYLLAYAHRIRQALGAADG